jgi:hypothetical protein
LQICFLNILSAKVVLKFRKTWLTIGLGFVVLVIYLSLTPDPFVLGASEGIKIGHVLAYGWLMLWFAQMYRSTSARLWFAAGLVALGILLEYLQGLTDYRGFEFSDMFINSTGVALGLLLCRSALQDALYIIETAVSQRIFPKSMSVSRDNSS